MTNNISGGTQLHWEFRITSYLVEEGSRRVLKEIGKEVQPSAVGHSNHDVLDTSWGTVCQDQCIPGSNGQTDTQRRLGTNYPRQESCFLRLLGRIS